VLLGARGPLILKADGPIYFSKKKTLEDVSFDSPISYYYYYDGRKIKIFFLKKYFFQFNFYTTN
jgi:hypothetical protein